MSTRVFCRACGLYFDATDLRQVGHHERHDCKFGPLAPVEAPAPEIRPSGPECPHGFRKATLHLCPECSRPAMEINMEILDR